MSSGEPLVPPPLAADRANPWPGLVSYTEQDQLRFFGRNRETLEPATEEASLIVNRMREHRILLGTDGPFHNVIKIRPPMPFSVADADLLVETMDGILAKDLAGC